jgi:hypothetical protein
MFAPWDDFWRGKERSNERQCKSVSQLTRLIFIWMHNDGRLNDLKRLACACRITHHIVKKFRLEFDSWELYNEKRNMKHKRYARNHARTERLQVLRYEAYDALIELVEDPKHYKHNCCWSHYVNKDTIVGQWTVEQTLFTFSKKCHRVRQKWKDRRGVVEFLHFYQYYRDCRGHDIHYCRSGKNISFSIHERSREEKPEKPWLHADWPGHEKSEDSEDVPEEDSSSTTSEEPCEPCECSKASCVKCFPKL